MSAFPSNYLNNKVLEKIFKNTNFTSPSALYLALYTTNPTAADTGTEATGGSYARKSITFATATGGTISSSNAQSFTNMPAGIFTHYGVRDASSGGNLIVFGALPSAITTNAGDEVTVDSGSIDFTFSGS